MKHAYQALDIACSLLLPSHVHPLDKWLLLRTVWQKRVPIQHRSKPQCMTNHKKRLCFPSEPVHCLESGKSRVWGIKGKRNKTNEGKQRKKLVLIVMFIHLLLWKWISFIPGGGTIVHALLLFINQLNQLNMPLSHPSLSVHPFKIFKFSDVLNSMPSAQ